MAALVPSSLPGQGLPAHMSRDGARRYVLPPMFAVFLFFFLFPPFQCHYRGFNETQLPHTVTAVNPEWKSPAGT